MDSDALRGWITVLDELTFYELLQVDPRASSDDIHAAFLRFAADFHPDAHAARIESERAMVERIFRRANEAYRVLSNPDLRARYDGIQGRASQTSLAAQSAETPPSQHLGGGGGGRGGDRASVAPPSTRSPSGPVSIRAAALARAAAAGAPSSTRTPSVPPVMTAAEAEAAKIAAVRASNIPKPLTLLEKVRNSGARPFVVRAEQLVKSGDPRQARIQLVLAMHMDMNNPALDEYLKHVEALIAGSRRK